METDKNQKDAGTKNSQTNPPPNFTGFDLNGLLNNASFMEWVKPLISGAGAMAGTYFMWIKPMQEKIEAMNLKIIEQEKQMTKLENEIYELENAINKSAAKTDNNNDNLKEKKEDYFEIKNRGERSGNFKKRRNLHL